MFCLQKACEPARKAHECGHALLGRSQDRETWKLPGRICPDVGEIGIQANQAATIDTAPLDHSRISLTSEVFLQHGTDVVTWLVQNLRDLGRQVLIDLQFHEVLSGPT